MKALFLKVKDFIIAHPVISRALHTFWQSFSSAFITGLIAILTNVFNGQLNMIWTSLIALFIASLASGLSALKTYGLSIKK